MKLSITLTAVALVAPAAFASDLPACSTDSVTPCSCPSGTTYAESATFAVIGAAADDFKAVTGDFFNTSWFGFLPVATQGPDNEPGVSTRTFNVPTSEGVYELTEKLTLLLDRPFPPAFIQKYEQLNTTVPVNYHSGTGSFSGYWANLEADYVFQYETAVIWSLYSCVTGHPIDVTRFFEHALSNANDILKAEGKLLGMTVPPRSTHRF